jgi:murein DD-endopeptidase MepM/ murein hydrolase activator NlpD
LSYIALQHGLDTDQLAEVNSLGDGNHIVKGQVLMLPGTAMPYRVARGETLGSIAMRFGVSEEKLVEMNELRDPDRLLAGQQLMIPAGQGGGSSRVSRGLPLNQLSWPVVGWISSPYGLRDGAMHEGIDIAADQGQPVRAVKDGRVVFAGPRGTYGITVIIDHGDGLRTLYAHNSRTLVGEGQRVTAGQRIALVGSTGRSTGPHLHLEVLLNGTPVDPMLCLERAYA